VVHFWRWVTYDLMNESPFFSLATFNRHLDFGPYSFMLALTGAHWRLSNDLVDVRPFISVAVLR